MPSRESSTPGAPHLPAFGRCGNDESESVTGAPHLPDVGRCGNEFDFHALPGNLRPYSVPHQTVTTEEAFAWCERLARNNYENFTVASWFLPRHLRPHFYNVYAYCRIADDLADEAPDAPTALALLDWWEGQLTDVYNSLDGKRAPFSALDNNCHPERGPLSATNNCHLERGPLSATNNCHLERGPLSATNNCHPERGPLRPESRDLAFSLPESEALKGHSSSPEFEALKGHSSSPESEALKGHGFSRAVPPQERTGALAPEVHPAFIALRETIRQFDIPREPFADLLTAFRQDQHTSRYDTFDDLLAYCRRSANPVGRLVLYLCGYSDAERQRLSDFTCTALQLANFWQDVSVDSGKGRLYIPLEDLRRFGVTEEQIARREFTPQFRALIAFEVERTRELFQRGLPLVRTVDRALSQDIELFSMGGLAILDAIEREGYNVLARRPALSNGAKLRLVGRAVARKVLR